MAWSRALRRTMYIMDSRIEKEKERRMRLRLEEIGGGIVRRTFKLGDRNVMSGERLDVETLAHMPAANRNALIESGKISVWPKDGGVIAAARVTAPAPAEGARRFIINKGFGNFAVVEGHQLNDAPLDKAAAEALAAEGQTAKH